ncbi:MAG: hypothetical protein LBE75_05055 [Burkholderiales bacterium]|jgi:hypothetical protein|nr:hypothetical protein [Burkholderiales bacterium]
MPAPVGIDQTPMAVVINAMLDGEKPSTVCVRFCVRRVVVPIQVTRGSG